MFALCGLAPVVFAAMPAVGAAEKPDVSAFQADYDAKVQPLVVRYCVDCHTGADAEAEIDLAAFGSFADVGRNLPVWQKVREMLDSEQMPPKDSDQPTDEERAALRRFVRDYLAAEAAAHAGDPGPVVLRRLNNAQYTYTIRDLTGVDALDPAREFPVDGAAGEGFTNTGAALVMSPALVTKYLDAAKDIANHAVLLPDGMRFSPSTSRRDWTEETLAQIRAFYQRFTAAVGGTAVNLQGLEFETNGGGRLPVQAYLAATLAHREALLAGQTSLADVARQSGLNLKYLTTLWQALTADADQAEQPSLVLDRLRTRWRAAKPEDAEALAAEIAGWQQALWKFNTIGHIGRHLGGTSGPATWLEAVTPLVPRVEFKQKLEAPPGAKEISIYLVASDAGDGSAGDLVVWERPRLVAPGRPDLALRDLRAVAAGLAAERERIATTAARCLAAAADADGKPDAAALDELARRHDVAPALVAAWCGTLGITAGETKIDSYLSTRSEKTDNYDFVKGWVGPDALSVVANASDEHVRIPGNMQPHGVAVHPTPQLQVVVGWRSPVSETTRIEGTVQHAHPECGNGVTWSLELRRGTTRQQLAAGISHGGAPVKIGPIENVAVRPGEIVALAIGPRDGNHSCDLTAVDLSIHAGQHEWNLAREVSPDILAGNPHADALGNAGVWHFYSEPAGEGSQWSIPAGSLLARWQSSPSADERTELADKVQELLVNGPGELPADAPDAQLYHQLTSLTGPLLSAVRDALVSQPPADAIDNPFGLDPAEFGTQAGGLEVGSDSVVVQAPRTIAIRLPADLVAGCEFVTAGTLHPQAGDNRSVQLQVATAPTEPGDLSPARPVVARPDSAAWQRFGSSFAEMGDLFPAALCYTKIVPVDEVITLNLFFREDGELRRLMLDDEQAAELDRLWDQLTYISREPLLLVAAFEQISEFATQDRPDKVIEFAPMRGPINARADAFRQRLVDTAPSHVNAVVTLANRAYRRPLTAAEATALNDFYDELRREEIDHEEAVRLLLARVLVSPDFLYRIEKPAPGSVQQPVSSDELASRLSYFLWSSLPDDELRRVADAGQLADTDVLLAQTRRMLADAKTRRLAAEFAAQWLHIYEFDQHDEKSERHFPDFAATRALMYEESLAFFTDMFQQGGSVLGILDADYAFLNDALASYYGIPGVEGPQWRRVEGTRQYGRGGILTQASILAKQSGASRTSPILRGNWLCEVVLGDKLPRPPKNVPVLAEEPPAGLTERQLIERHSTDAACAKCHVRIDPFGFALENYDAVGRFREKDAAGLTIDAKTKLQDGTELDGLTGLRAYLLGPRRNDFLRQFNRKLLGYALGRSVQLSDEPLLDQMQTALEQNDYRASVAIETIVASPQFRDIRGQASAQQDPEP